MVFKRIKCGLEPLNRGTKKTNKLFRFREKQTLLVMFTVKWFMVNLNNQQ